MTKAKRGLTQEHNNRGPGRQAVGSIHEIERIDHHHHPKRCAQDAKYGAKA